MAQSINYCLPHSQALLARTCIPVIFQFIVRCGLVGWYINPVCLKYIIDIVEAGISVLNLTGRARQDEGGIKTLDCPYGSMCHLFCR
ncbi:unnamed protein product [Schistosoma curassoni]|uniref:Uncharacterized protein n=1 Tax=Schistosoma curassoni TaxID=6186 RepID=A0A183JZT0_9TREM|nr:unnamed protein product [Schistosoma curassoni]